MIVLCIRMRRATYCVCLLHGTLQDNIETLATKADSLTDGKQKKHVNALVAVARYIITNGPVVKTQDAGKLYMREKGLGTRAEAIYGTV